MLHTLHSPTSSQIRLRLCMTNGEVFGSEQSCGVFTPLGTSWCCGNANDRRDRTSAPRSKRYWAARLEDWPFVYFGDGVWRNLTGRDGALRHPRRAAAAQRVSRDWHLKRDPFRPL